MHVLASATLTFAAWFIFVLLGFLSAALLVSWAITRLIPPHQERIPRHLAILAGLVTSIMASAPAALQVGAAEAVLALGDSMAARRTVILLPFQDSGGFGPALARLRDQMRFEVQEIRTLGIVRYSIRYIALGTVTEGIETVRAVNQSMAGEGERPGKPLRYAWADARPALAHIVLRKIAGCVVFASLHWGLMVAGGLLLILISRGELVRVSRAVQGDSR